MAPALLRLQDECAADVCLLLFLLWGAAAGASVNATTIATIDAAIAPWRAGVVQPLRAARRALPNQPGALRDQVKHDEMESERLQLLTLERFTPGEANTAPHTAARDALAAYAAFLGVTFPADAMVAIVAATDMTSHREL